jgi:hypothetical protein
MSPLNLVGLLKASKVGAARGQGFRLYARGAGDGARITDYMVTSLTRTGGTATGTPIAPFTNITFVAEYTQGDLADGIFDEQWDGQVQLVLGTPEVDGFPAGPQEFFGPAGTLRSVAINRATREITATVTLNNWIYFDDDDPPLAGEGFFVAIPVALSFRPEMYFNVARTSDTAIYSVRPYRLGQPTPESLPQSIIGIPSEDDWEWSEDPANPPNERVTGVTVRCRFAGSGGGWWNNFNGDYAGTGLTLEYTWERLVGAEWVFFSLQTRDGANVVPDPSLLLNGAPNEEFEMRVTVQVTAPFVSPPASHTRVITIPDAIRGPGGGPIV